MTASLQRNSKPIDSPRNRMLNRKAVRAVTLNQLTPYADKMTALGTLEPLSAFLFGHHLEVIALHTVWASDGIWHSLSATKGSVTFGPLPYLLGSVPEAPARRCTSGEGGLVGPECRRDARYVTPSVSLEQ